jgi:hypothetical protein
MPHRDWQLTQVHVLSELPDDISRRLFGALRLEISFDHDQVTFRITLTGDTIDIVRRITEAVVLPFRRTSTDNTGNGRYASDLGEEESQKAEGDVVPFCMVPPTGPSTEGNRVRPVKRTTGALVIESAFQPRPGPGSR